MEAREGQKVSQAGIADRRFMSTSALLDVEINETNQRLEREFAEAAAEDKE